MFLTERKGKEKQKYVYFGRRNTITFQLLGVLLLFYFI